MATTRSDIRDKLCHHWCNAGVEAANAEHPPKRPFGVLHMRHVAGASKGCSHRSGKIPLAFRARLRK